MAISFMDLKTQYQRLEPEIRRGIDAVLAHGRYIMGPEVAELERRLAEWVGVKHAVSCASGTDALLMPLMAHGIQPGDAVFTTPFSFIATAEVVALLGATPIFVDIDPETFNMDPAKLTPAVAAVKREGRLRPRAIIPVDLFGLPADDDAIMAVAARDDLLVIEDAAQSIGGVYQGRRCGSLGHVASTSFYPAKPLGAYGDGGMIFTDDDDLNATLTSIREHGQGSDRYDNVRLGLNGRLDSIQAAVLLAKLAVFEQELSERQRVADLYAAALRGVTPQTIPAGYRSGWALYSVLSDQREPVMAKLKQADIPSVIYYRKPLHLQPVFRHMCGKEGDFPVAESVAQRIFSLPMHPFLTETDIQRIAEIIATKASPPS